MIDGHEIAIGSLSLVEEYKTELPKNIKKEITFESKKGKTIIFVLKGKEILGALALGDIIREESREAIKALKAYGIRIAMITGDSDEVAKWVATDLDIDEYFAKVLPDKKAAKVKSLQKKGRKKWRWSETESMMLLRLRKPTLALPSAPVQTSPSNRQALFLLKIAGHLLKIIKLSRFTYAKMIQNLFWATGYNAIALPLGAGVLASQGILMQPAIAAIFMSLSTVIVAVNAVLLKRKTL